MTLVAIPLVVLYEVSIFISAKVIKKKEKDRKEFFGKDEKNQPATS
jgi:Sec-independent protein secretion pathway component TatC